MSTEEYLKFMIQYLSEKDKVDEEHIEEDEQEQNIYYSNKWFGTIPFMFKYVFIKDKEA